MKNGAVGELPTFRADIAANFFIDNFGVAGASSGGVPVVISGAGIVISTIVDLSKIIIVDSVGEGLGRFSG